MGRKKDRNPSSRSQLPLSTCMQQRLNSFRPPMGPTGPHGNGWPLCSFFSDWRDDTMPKSHSTLKSLLPLLHHLTCFLLSLIHRGNFDYALSNLIISNWKPNCKLKMDLVLDSRTFFLNFLDYYFSTCFLTLHNKCFACWVIKSNLHWDVRIAPPLQIQEIFVCLTYSSCSKRYAKRVHKTTKNHGAHIR